MKSNISLLLCKCMGQNQLSRELLKTIITTKIKPFDYLFGLVGVEVNLRLHIPTGFLIDFIYIYIYIYIYTDTHTHTQNNSQRLVFYKKIVLKFSKTSQEDTHNRLRFLVK